VVFFGLILLQIVSLALCAVTVRRLYAYINKYRFDESVYTLLLRFVRLRYIVSAYIFMITLSAAIGVLFSISMITGPG